VEQDRRVFAACRAVTVRKDAGQAMDVVMILASIRRLMGLGSPGGCTHPPALQSSPCYMFGVLVISI
jgi:hypothetical protein